MADDKLWDYDLYVNDNQVSSPLVFEWGESSQSQYLGFSSSSNSEGHGPLNHQTVPDYGFSSFLEEYEREYEQNPESHLLPNPLMLNDHDSSSEENPIARENSAMAYLPTLEAIPPKSSLVHDLVSPFQETGNMDYIPTFVEDAKMAESAPFSSLVHLASLPEEEFQETVMNSNMVYNHVDSSNKGNVTMAETIQTPKIHSSNEGNVAMEETIQTPKIHSPNEGNNVAMEETIQTPKIHSPNEGNVAMEETIQTPKIHPSNEGNVTVEETIQTPKIHSPNEGNVTMEETMPNPVTLGENGVPNEQEGLDKIPCPAVTFSNHAKPQVCWTPALHVHFLRAIKHLGRCRLAKPKDILQLMNVEGLNRTHVASHLQKYRKGRFRC